MQKDIISTWIYLDNPNESSEYPQVGKASHLQSFQNVYWKCVAVFYALSVRMNPNRKHILFSNQIWEELPIIEGFDLKKSLQNLNVELVTLPLKWQTPEGYFGKWRNQFYIFDVLAYLETRFKDDEAVLVLDSDCLINQSLDGLFSKIHETGLMVLPMPYDENHVINGVTRTEMQQIYQDFLFLQKKEIPLPIYYGGEVFAAKMTAVKKINEIAPLLWDEMMKRHQTHRPKLNEEAHFLSFCYFRIGKFGLLDDYIKRIWTSPKFNNVTSVDVNLPIWHLPSEKKGGIALLFEKLKKNPQLLPKSDAEMQIELGKYVGLPKRTKWLNLKQRLMYLLKK
jgi:hypothetical protein